ncbi:MAG: hypothetical protein ACP5OG_04830 [Candidatus Nanoarchaeia archaeon]
MKKRGKANMNKKGAEMTIGTIIVIILALLVLVVLIYGFTTGWGDLWGKMKNYFGFGSKVNIDEIKTACTLACTTNAEYAFCTQTRQVVFQEGQPAKPYTCFELITEGHVAPCDAIPSCPNQVKTTEENYDGECAKLTTSTCSQNNNCKIEGNACVGK